MVRGSGRLAISEDFAMRKTVPSLSTRTEEFAPRELPLDAPKTPQVPTARPETRTADRIKDALLRWLEEEM
jgi:hypothetical protein